MANPVVVDRRSYPLKQRGCSKSVRANATRGDEPPRVSAGLVRPFVEATANERLGRVTRGDERVAQAWRRRQLRIALARQFATPLTAEQQGEMAALRSIQEAAARELLSRADEH